jgi:hypothetical protein
MDNFNQLTPAETERLSILAEECAEVIQIVQKIQRHGYESYNPLKFMHKTNRILLEEELGHVKAALFLLEDANDIKGVNVLLSSEAKTDSYKRGDYTHHQEILPPRRGN